MEDVSVDECGLFFPEEAGEGGDAGFSMAEEARQREAQTCEHVSGMGFWRCCSSEMGINKSAKVLETAEHSW